MRRITALDFRAFIGAVSLKLDAAVDLSQGLADFRAFIGAVSLKQ